MKEGGNGVGTATLAMASMWIVLVALLTAPGFLAVVADAAPCDDYNCVQGKCVEVNGFPPVKCVCDSGWSNIMNFTFLSCAIPDCDFNFDCDKGSSSKADAAPAPKLADDAGGLSILNPCSYSVCGKGDCVVENDTSLIHSYTCHCHPGYVNLLNQTSGICVSNCNIGANCDQLGLGLGPSASPSSTDKNSSSTLSDTSDSGAQVSSGTSWSLLVGGVLGAGLFL